MMKNSKIFALILLVALYACKTITYSDLTPNHPLENKIVSLTPKIDKSSFDGAYTRGSTEISGGNINVDIQRTPVSLGLFDAGTVQTNDKRKTDIIGLFKRDVLDNICEQGAPRGSIELSIAFEDEFHKKEWGWAYLPVLFLPSLFGAPAFWVQEELVLDVYIRDEKNTIVRKYSSKGVGKTPVALYWGYQDILYDRKMTAGNRKANIDAYKNAMKKIKIQIENDCDFLRAKLQ